MSAAKPLAASERMTWFDANRVFAALGVVLIHCTTDAAGQAFTASSPGERVIPVILRSIAEISGSEMFFVFSLFLIAFKLDRRQPTYARMQADQAKRLLIPFAVWTIFFAFFRLFKASAFGYSDAIWSQLGDWSHWVSYFVLGTAQYHMHFLPTLFLLGLLYPVMRLAIRYPIVGLAVFGLLGGMDYVQGWLWGNVTDPMLRDYLLRGMKVLGYVGYGFAAFGLYGAWKRGLKQEDARLVVLSTAFLAVFCFLVAAVNTATAIETGEWPLRLGWPFFGHFLLPVFVLAAFMGAQHFPWSPRFTWFARFTFGVYLIHPVMVDLYDVVVHALNIAPAPTVMVVSKYIFAVPATFAAAYGISRLKPLAWLIGLGPIPFIGEHAKPPMAAAAPPAG